MKTRAFRKRRSSLKEVRKKTPRKEKIQTALSDSFDKIGKETNISTSNHFYQALTLENGYRPRQFSSSSTGCCRNIAGKRERGVKPKPPTRPTAAPMEQPAADSTPTKFPLVSSNNTTFTFCHCSIQTDTSLLIDRSGFGGKTENHFTARRRTG